uniref:SHSP domain-containing protein n=1 Tax=Panagrellus redivivus TaxID=6233 RepID=A0A7E4V6S3_PANRE
MSLFSHNPLIHEALARRDENPLATTLQRVADDAGSQLSENPAHFRMNPDGGFDYTVNIEGFQPNELHVDLEGDQIVVRGEHAEIHEGEAAKKSFLRKMTLPPNFSKDQIHCDLDSAGNLTIHAEPNTFEGIDAQPDRPALRQM